MYSNKIHYGDDAIDKKDNKNNNDESTTVDNNAYIATDACSDAIDVGIHNKSDDACSSAIDVGTHSNNKGFYFGTFDEVYYDDENAPSVFVKLDQGSNKDNSNCSVVIPSSRGHTSDSDTEGWIEVIPTKSSF